MLRAWHAVASSGLRADQEVYVTTEAEIEEEELIEARTMDVTLLQTSLSTHAALAQEPEEKVDAQSEDPIMHDILQKNNETALNPVVGNQSTFSNISLVEANGDLVPLADDFARNEESPSTYDRIVELDHNGRVCMLCGKPLADRVGARQYTEFRLDCGNRSSSTGPNASTLHTPVEFFNTDRSVSTSFVQKREGDSSNGFCELNFAKSCADAIVNRDYLYWPKSLDLASAAMKDNTPWDGRYCQLNGFLERDVVSLQHNFSAMQAKGKELCRSKYTKHGVSKLNFLDMMKRTRYRDANAPTTDEAETLAAWNCAMGDLGCDMAMCAYSFCKRPGSATPGLYGECAGWHPEHGMPF